jgi:hypothetical protein
MHSGILLKNFKPAASMYVLIFPSENLYKFDQRPNDYLATIMTLFYVEDALVVDTGNLHLLGRLAVLSRLFTTAELFESHLHIRCEEGHCSLTH